MNSEREGQESKEDFRPLQMKQYVPLSLAFIVKWIYSNLIILGQIFLLWSVPNRSLHHKQVM